MLLMNPNVSIGTLVYRRDSFTRRDWGTVLGRIAAGVSQKKLSLLSAGVAFFAMLALFPAIAATISLFGYVSDPVMVQENMQLLEPIIPEQVFSLISQQVTSVVSAEREALGIASVVSLLFATWSARAGVGAVIMGLNAIAHEQDERNFVWTLVVAYGLTLLLIFVTLVAVAAVIVVPAILAFFPLGGAGSLAVNAVRWVVALVTVVMGIGALYRFGPSRRHRRMPYITLGNIVASMLWIAGSVLFSVYLSNFGNYNQIYGSLGAVIALLMWFYVSAFVVLLGAELNAEMEAHAESLIRARHPELPRSPDDGAHPTPDSPI